jgi:hypothetical protein
MARTGPWPRGHAPSSSLGQGGGPRRGTRNVRGQVWTGDLREPTLVLVLVLVLETVQASGPDELAVGTERVSGGHVGPPTWPSNHAGVAPPLEKAVNG